MGKVPLECRCLSVKLAFDETLAIEGCGETIGEPGVLAQAGVGVQRGRGRVSRRRSISCRQGNSCLACICCIGGGVCRWPPLYAGHL